MEHHCGGYIQETVGWNFVVWSSSSWIKLLLPGWAYCLEWQALTRAGNALSSFDDPPSSPHYYHAAVDFCVHQEDQYGPNSFSCEDIQNKTSSSYHYRLHALLSSSASCSHWKLIQNHSIPSPMSSFPHNFS